MEMETLQQMAPWDWPEGSDQDILAVLQDKSAGEETRQLAAVLAGDFAVLNDDLANELINILTDDAESDELRARAAISFGVGLAYGDENGFGDDADILVSEPVFDRMRQVLKDVYTDQSRPKVVRRSALEASVRAPEEWHRDAVRAAYESDDPKWKLTGVFCMQYIRGFDKEILESLNSDDVEIHKHAVAAAGTWSLTEAGPHVLGLLEDEVEDRDLLIAAIDAAPFVSPDEAASKLADYTDHEDDEVAEAASESLMYAQGGGIDVDGEDEFDDEEDEDEYFDEEEDEFEDDEEDADEDEEDL